MKTNIFITLFLLAFAAHSQEPFKEQLVVPLSNPSARGVLSVGLIRGDIMIEAYSGKEVIIDAVANANEDCKDCEEPKPAPNGMKRISTNSIDFSASENANKVKIETNSFSKALNLTIKLPANFDLDVSTVHGKVTIKGINGTHEVSAVHGPITLTEMAGSALCNTVHGDVIATFTKVNAEEPMSFVTLHGNVDVTLPASTKATAKLKSDRGEIFTDFDMSIEKSKPEVDSKTGSYKVSMNAWVYGKINGGGPEYTLKNMHGDIYLRKK